MLGAAIGRFPGWHAHPDVWALVGALAVGYTAALRRGRPPGLEGGVATRRQRQAFWAGLVVIWVASDWPIHDLSEHSLYSVHMVQHLLYVLVAAPLLLAGIPENVAQRVLGRGFCRRTVRWITRPVPALAIFNVVLVFSHWPLVVNYTLEHHPAHFAVHVVLLASALVMWWPVIGPIRADRISPPMQMLYLFLQTIVPTVPASFLTLGSAPLYHFYVTVPRLYGISALADQQLAGVIMKIVGGFYLYSIIGVVFFRWYADEERRNGPQTLTWQEVEAELRRYDVA